MNEIPTQGNMFVRKIDKSAIPTCNILGVNVAAIDMKWLLEFTNTNINDLAGDYMCVSNVHTTVTAWEDPSYCAVQNGGILAIPDGSPLSIVGQKRGFKNMKRTTGPCYMEEIFKISVEKGYRHYFYGSTEVTLRKLCQISKCKYPGIQIVGTYSPPFRQLTFEENQVVIDHINKSNPDFIWVGLGAPKQERWMSENLGKVNGFMVGVGAGFDYYVGNLSRAPKWMQKCSLEWLYRLLQDPKRLFNRYWHTNTRFIWHVFIRKR